MRRLPIWLTGVLSFLSALLLCFTLGFLQVHRDLTSSGVVGDLWGTPIAVGPARTPWIYYVAFAAVAAVWAWLLLVFAKDGNERAAGAACWIMLATLLLIALSLGAPAPGVQEVRGQSLAAFLREGVNSPATHAFAGAIAAIGLVLRRRTSPPALSAVPMGVPPSSTSS